MTVNHPIAMGQRCLKFVPNAIRRLGIKMELGL